jgi:hypothetical protein
MKNRKRGLDLSPRLCPKSDRRLRVILFSFVSLSIVLTTACFIWGASEVIESKKKYFIPETYDVSNINCKHLEYPDICEQEVNLIKSANEDKVKRKAVFEEYQKIADKCPIPVFVIDRYKFSRDFLEKVKSKNADPLTLPYLHGLYISAKSMPLAVRDDWPNEFIFVHDNGSPDFMIGILLHEIGHHLCHKNHCSCYDLGGDEVYMEAHAIRYSLEMLMAHEFTEALVIIYHDVKVAATGDYGIEDRDPARLVMKDEIWELVEDALRMKGVVLVEN